MRDRRAEVRRGEAAVCVPVCGNPVKPNSSNLTPNSGSFLLLEDFTRPGSEQSWGQVTGRQLRDTPKSSFWSGVPGNRDHLGPRP